jgi:hypothetical protein
MDASFLSLERDQCAFVVKALGFLSRRSLRASRDLSGETSTPFHSSAQPDLSLADYGFRLSTYLNLEGPAWCVAMVYLDTFLKVTRVSLDSFSVHRLVLTAISLALDWLEDEGPSIQRQARVGGIRCRELNILRVAFLDALRWNLFVRQERYCEVYAIVSESVGKFAQCGGLHPFQERQSGPSDCTS